MLNNGTTVQCYHGGAFFETIGAEFDHLERRHDIINADVLDAWFPPSPKVLAALQQDLPWLLRTSPPTQCEGLTRVIARMRGVPEGCVLPSAGSSDAIFLAFRHWLTAASRVLILDPMYGEYAHVLEKVIGCWVVRLPLLRDQNYRVNLEELEQLSGAGQAHRPEPCRTSPCVSGASGKLRSQHGYDLIVLVNPNSPTGQHVPREQLEAALRRVPTDTLVWVDETYVDYVGEDQSLERFAAASQNVVVCKSMSKVYALSGVRAAYLCGPERIIAGLRGFTPPWAVGLPAQVAAVAALQDPEYYAARIGETHGLRDDLARQLARFEGWEVIPSVANFILCHLPVAGPTAAEVVSACRLQGLFLRDVGSMGRSFGRHALRVAVKDADTNRRMVEMIECGMRSAKCGMGKPSERLMAA